MNDQLIEERRDGMLLSTDRARVDLDAVLAMLRDSHWGGGVTRDVLRRAVTMSLCVGVYDAERQLRSPEPSPIWRRTPISQT